MEISWKFHGETVEKIWRLCGGSIIVEKTWRIYGTFVEKQIWRNCGKLTHWKTNTLENYRLENYRLENTKDAIQWSGTRKQLEGLNMLRKIIDWATSESGKEVLTGVFWGAVGIIAVRIFCFLVCLATGYPANPWNILFWL